ncbi:MAG: hypothetical protein HY689_10810 [Chloroflexi bacterium]|nr:hypothetical protein [Chloroflexota bacterium]
MGLRHMHRALLRTGSGLLLLGGALALVADLSTPQASSAPEAATPVRTIPFTGVNPIGVNVFLGREVERWKKERTLEMAKAAGAGWIKEIFSWEEIEPKKGVYWDDKFKKSTWEKYDELVDLAERFGLRIIARLDRTPAWARKDTRLPTAPPDRLEDYGDFVYEVVKRYAGRVQFFQIWNEPNIYPEWGDRPPDPAGYTELLKLASQRAKDANPDAIIISAPLAQTLERSARNLTELDYLDGMYRAGAAGAFDILAANAYGFEFPPTAPADPNVLNYARLQLLRRVMERHGDHNTPVWFNEFGWNAAPPSFPVDQLIWQRVTEQQQAQYTADAITLARRWGWVGVMSIWYFRHVGDIPPDRPDYYFRMVDTEFTPRPVYHAVKQLGERLRVVGPGVYQESNAAVEAEGRWAFRLLPDASAGAVLQPHTPDAALTLTFEGTDVALLAGVGPQGGRLRVTVDGQDAGLEQKDAAGRSYVDLVAPERRFGVQLVLARGLRPGRHTLRLEPVGAAGQEWFIDGFAVESRPVPAGDRVWLSLGLVVLGALGLAASFVVRRTP